MHLDTINKNMFKLLTRVYRHILCHIFTSFSVKYSLLPVICTLSFVKMLEVPPLNYTTEGISTVNVNVFKWQT